jgi:hypothetical protein
LKKKKLSNSVETYVWNNEKEISFLFNTEKDKSYIIIGTFNDHPSITTNEDDILNFKSVISIT